MRLSVMTTVFLRSWVVVAQQQIAHETAHHEGLAALRLRGFAEFAEQHDGIPGQPAHHEIAQISAAPDRRMPVGPEQVGRDIESKSDIQKVAMWIVIQSGK